MNDPTGRVPLPAAPIPENWEDMSADQQRDFIEAVARTWARHIQQSQQAASRSNDLEG